MRELKANIDLLKSHIDFLSCYDGELDEERSLSYYEFAKNKFAQFDEELEDIIKKDFTSQGGLKREKINDLFENHLDNLIFIIKNIQYLNELFFVQTKYSPFLKLSLILNGVREEKHDDIIVSLHADGFASLTFDEVFGDESKDEFEFLSLMQYLHQNDVGEITFKVKNKRNFVVKNSDVIDKIIESILKSDSKYSELLRDEDFLKNKYRSSELGISTENWERLQSELKSIRKEYLSNLKGRKKNAQFKRPYLKSKSEAKFAYSLYQYLNSNTKFTVAESSKTAYDQLYIIGKVLIWSGVFSLEYADGTNNNDNYLSVYEHVRGILAPRQIPNIPQKPFKGIK